MPGYTPLSFTPGAEYLSDCSLPRLQFDCPSPSSGSEASSPISTKQDPFLTDPIMSPTLRPSSRGGSFPRSLSRKSSFNNGSLGGSLGPLDNSFDYRGSSAYPSLGDPCGYALAAPQPFTSSSTAYSAGLTSITPSSIYPQQSSSAYSASQLPGDVYYGSSSHSTAAPPNTASYSSLFPYGGSSGAAGSSYYSGLPPTQSQHLDSSMEAAATLAAIDNWELPSPLDSVNPNAFSRSSSNGRTASYMPGDLPQSLALGPLPLFPKTKPTQQSRASRQRSGQQLQNGNFGGTGYAGSSGLSYSGSLGPNDLPPLPPLLQQFDYNGLPPLPPLLQQLDYNGGYTSSMAPYPPIKGVSQLSQTYMAGDNGLGYTGMNMSGLGEATPRRSRRSSIGSLSGVSSLGPLSGFTSGSGGMAGLPSLGDLPPLPQLSQSSGSPRRGTYTKQNMHGLISKDDVDRSYPGEWGQAFR